MLTPSRAAARLLVACASLAALLALAGCTGTGTPGVPAAIKEPMLVEVEVGEQTVIELLQPAVGLLAVSITDPEGKPVPDATLVLEDARGKVVAHGTGSMVLNHVLPGRHVLSVSATGYSTSQTTFDVPAGVITNSKIVLQSASVAPGSTAMRGFDSLEPSLPWLVVPAGLLASGAAILLNKDVRARRAKQLLASGDARRAERIARRIVARHPTHHDALFVLGAALLSLKRPQEAARILESSSSQLDPEIAGLAFLITLAHRDMNQPERARRWLSLVARDPQYWDALSCHDGEALRAILKPRANLAGYA